MEILKSPFMKAGAIIIIGFLVLVVLLIIFSPLSRFASATECNERTRCYEQKVAPKNGRCGNMADVSDIVEIFVKKNDGKVLVVGMETLVEMGCVTYVRILYFPKYSTGGKIYRTGAEETFPEFRRTFFRCFEGRIFPREMKDYLEDETAKEIIIRRGTEKVTVEMLSWSPSVNHNGEESPCVYFQIRNQKDKFVGPGSYYRGLFFC